ncbi:MAG: hypothetical protein ACK5RJ_14155 [Burkholderiales bacterium]|jgi:hypothetical protein|nr:hypothetical protein [Rhodocyclaceae bacterium]MCA3051597.1 hypothetical protein [Rhodocyclaceae bacterium]MCA3057979.1 hypothetical protein [Rhodocyclaceae bacterium]MCA3167515.1 hypothetical protein [Burkholderiales bacterium]MCE2724611.1 hypothetical protein [Betaproteobacteria bacterium]
MNKKSEAELLAAQMRMAAQRDAVVALLKKKKWSKIKLQSVLNGRLRRAGCEEIRGESYFAKKLRGDRGGFRGPVEAQLRDLCDESDIRWESSDSLRSRVKRLNAKIGQVQNERYYVSRAEFVEEQLSAMREAALRRAIDVSRKLTVSIEAKERVGELHPSESADVLDNLQIRNEIFMAIERILDIPRGYREHYRVDADRVSEMWVGAIYDRRAIVRTKAPIAAKKKK